MLIRQLAGLSAILLFTLVVNVSGDARWSRPGQKLSMVESVSINHIYLTEDIHGTMCYKNY